MDGKASNYISALSFILISVNGLEEAERNKVLKFDNNHLEN